VTPAERREDRKRKAKIEQERRAKEGLCSSFGCPHPRLPGRSRCQECADKAAARSAEDYRRKKARGVCVHASKCREPVIPGQTLCQKHRDDQAKRTAAGREAYAPRQKEVSKACYEKAKAEGICTQCHDKPAVPGNVHCEDCKQYHSGTSQQRNEARRKLVLEKYDNKCACCPETIIDRLEIDHIAGGGNEHRREIGRSGLYAWLIKNNFPPGYQALCASCHLEKTKKGFCSHQRRDRYTAADRKRIAALGMTIPST
jgi:hypothetical protein